MSKSFFSALLASSVALAGLASGSPVFKSTTGNYLSVPVANSDYATAENTIPGKYIVVYNSTFEQDVITTHQLAVTHKIKKRNLNKRNFMGSLMSTTVKTVDVKGWRGMILEADDDMIMDIMSDETVAYVEADTYVKASAIVAQSDAPLGLRRLSVTDAEALNTNGGEASRTTPAYTFDDTGGEGVTVYVVDTGVRITHSEFQGRAIFGFNAITNEVGGDADDDNGHGSHVAGTIAGRTFGVAKNAQIVAVKVLDADGGGANSDVLQGIEFVSQNATSGKSVMNMSLGGGRSNAINNAINSLVQDDNIVPVVAAGNEFQDTDNTSPGSARSAITVGAIDAADDSMASFSNFGPAVDIFAPGVDVLSVGITNDRAMAVLSGTSMACPHVAGLAAYLMSTEGLSTVDGVNDRIKELAQATAGRVSGTPSDTTTLIANNGETV